MVFVLVLATFLVLAAGGWLAAHRRDRIAGEESLFAESEKLRAGAVYLHPGMAWVRGPSGRAVTVGASTFAVDFTGKLASIELPHPGERLREGETALTLVSAGGRRLALPTPVAGRVLAANPDPMADPCAWLLRVKPEGALSTVLDGQAARRWIDEARALVLSRLEPAVGPLAGDGGLWTPAWGELLDDRTWTELKRDLFPEGMR